MLNLSAFDLDQVLQRRPTFLEPEYPFEWTGVFSLEKGRYELTLEEGPDPTMSLVLLLDQGKDETALNTGAESCVRLYAEQEQPMNPGDIVPFGKHVSLQLQSEGTKSFLIDVDKAGDIGLFTQHTAEEFSLKITKVQTSTAEDKIVIKDFHNFSNS